MTSAEYVSRANVVFSQYSVGAELHAHNHRWEDWKLACVSCRAELSMNTDNSVVDSFMRLYLLMKVL